MQHHTSSFGRRASDGGAHLPHGSQPVCCHSAPHRVSDSAPVRDDEAGHSEEPATDASYNSNLCRYMMNRGSSKRHTMATTEDAASAVTVCTAGSMPNTSPSSTSSIRVRRTGLHTVTERPPVISPELVLEVERRMNRNYLPPSIQGGYQYPSSCQSGFQSPMSTQNVPQSPSQNTMVSSSYNMKPVLETIPQGSVIGTKGSSQAASPFTPSMTQFSPSYGAVVSQNQGSITCGTPINYDNNKNFTFQSNSAFDFTNVSNISGSIVSGTPVNTNQSMSNTYENNFNYGNAGPAGNFGSITSGTPYITSSSSFVPINSTSNFGSICSGTPVNTGNTGNFNFINTVSSNTGSNIGAPMHTDNNSDAMSTDHDNFGSITSGTPMNNPKYFGSISTGTPISSSNYRSISTGSLMNTNNSGNFGSVSTGISFNTENNGSMNSGTSMNGGNIRSFSIGSPIYAAHLGSISAGTPMNTNNSAYYGSITPMKGGNSGNVRSMSTGTPIKNVNSGNLGSISAGTPMTNTNPVNFGSISAGTPMNTDTCSNFGSISTGTPMEMSNSGNYGSVTTGTLENYGSGSASTPKRTTSAGQMYPMQSNAQTGSITAGTPVQSNFGTNYDNTRQRRYSGPQRIKLQMLATVQEMERYSPVRRAECSPPRAAHDLASARLEYQQLQRGLERRSGGAGASPPLADVRLHTPAVSMPGSPVHAAAAPTLDLGSVSSEAARAVLRAARGLLSERAHAELHRSLVLTQDVSLKLGINLHTLTLPHVNVSQEILKSIHTYSNLGLLSGPAAPPSPGSPLRHLTERLSGLLSGAPLDLRSAPEPQLHPMVHPQIHIVTHRSLNNSPISNPGSPLDMIQEETGNGNHDKLHDRTFPPFQSSTHPQISLTDCLGSEITLVASSSEDSMDSLENTKYPLPQFVISEPSDLDDRPSITKGIGRKVSQETEPTPVELPKEEKDQEMSSPKEEENKFLTEDSKSRRGSEKSLGFSDDSLSNDSTNVSPNCELNIHSIYSNVVSFSSGFSENRGSFSEHRESFSFSDRGSFSERGDFGRSSFSERSDLGRSSFSEKGETPRSSFSAQGILGELKEYGEDVYMSKDTSRLEKCDEEKGSEEIDKLQRSTMDLRLTEVCRPYEQIPILLSPQKISCVQESFEVTLSTVCSKLDSQRIVELLKEAINTRVPPQNIFVDTNHENEDSELTGFLNLEYSGGIQIELVVCENKARKKKGLKMRRISGDQTEYGKLCQQLITSLTV